MKKLIFKEVLLLSQTSRKSKRITFDEKFNIILGKNSTGKSSLLKSLYFTFGAEPFKTHDKWKNENIISLLKFKIIDDNLVVNEYSLLRNSNSYTIFDGNNNKLKSFSSITNGLSPYINDYLLDFKIKLNNRENNITGLTPNYLFLPFYIDQDISWSKNWSSFSKLEQFKNWKKDLIEFYVGIKPNEYYEKKGKININNNSLSDLKKEALILDNLKNNIDKKISINLDFINLEDFTKEIDDLLDEMKKLSNNKNKYVTEINDLNNQKLTLIEQIEYTKNSLKEVNSNYDFIMDTKNQLECPVCGNYHEASFKEKFEIAKDQDNCIILLKSLENNLSDVEHNIKTLKDKYVDLEKQFNKINDIVIQKKSDIKLIDIIKSEGKKELRKVFNEEENDLNINIGQLTSENEKLNNEIKKIIDKKRVQIIKNEYISIIKKYFKELDVSNILEKSYNKLNSEIIETGSNSPRALLAYYMAIIKLIHKNNTSTFCPIIIDSPNQQGQDKNHLPMMLEFIKNNTPENSQIILGLEDTCDIKFPGKIIELENVNSLLMEDNYEENFIYLKEFINKII